MTLPSGQISADQINTELGRPWNQGLSLNDGASRNLAGRPGGSIAYSDFHGKSRLFEVPGSAINGIFYNKELGDLARMVGWDGVSSLKITLNSGVQILSGSPGSYALTITANYPNGVELINNGYIVGCGGQGGWNVSGGRNGQSGGPALLVTGPVKITNYGLISGGGGGGGEGGSGDQYSYTGGGGGGAGYGAGGANGGGNSSPGSAGSLTGGGAGGNGSSYGGYGNDRYGWGGASGGGLGAGGGAGGGWFGGNGAGGAGGQAIAGNGNINWSITSGTIYGGIS